MPKHTEIGRVVNIGVLVLAIAAVLAAGCGGGNTSETPASRANLTPDRGANAEPAAMTATAAAARSVTPDANGATPGSGGSSTSGSNEAQAPLIGTVDPEYLPPSPTPLPPSGLSMELGSPTSIRAGSTFDTQVRVVGTSATRIGAFNFDIVYDQTQVVLEAPQVNQRLLDATGREFHCDLPQPSGDIEAAPAVGRARLVCYSFGSSDQPGFAAPAMVATIRLRALVPGDIELQWERVALYRADGSSLGTVDHAPSHVHAD